MEKRFGVISADGHCRLMHLPFDLWTKRLPRRFQDDGPRVVTGPDGVRQWVVEGRAWSGVGWAGVGRGPVNCYTRAGLPEEPEPGIFRAANARYRCEDMDKDGVDAELVNGPYEQISQIKNPELRAVCVRAVNDWARELYAESNGRFIMLLPLPCMSPEEATAELLRVAGFGLPTGVIFDWVFAPEPVMHQMWERVWAAAAETGMPVNLHAYPSGGTRQIGVGVPGLEPRNQALMRVANFPMGAMAELMSAVVFSGICDRHRAVRFVLEEAGVGWVPFMFWRFDREYEFGPADNRVFKPDIALKRSPSEIVKEHVFFTFEVEEEGGFRRAPEVGLGNFLWASDFPGLDSPWPNSKAMGHAPCEAALGKAALHQLVFENARTLYKIPVTLPQREAAAAQ
ncbi:MAG TPA: amidohydrolase family protein [Stellaceae bacterium]|nr:amidohydrolase family protein [Stellaceae bacterium]